MSHLIGDLEKLFSVLVKKFKVVSFVPGNHDLWLIKGDKSSPNSAAKFDSIMQLCDKYGVKRQPHLLESDDKALKVWLVPLFSWYNEEFDEDESTKGERIRRELWGDYMHCKWPEAVINPDSETPSCPTGTPEAYFSAMNESALQAVLASPDTASATIISFSHFLPRIECSLTKEQLPFYGKFWHKVEGSKKLEAQIRRLGSHIHIFGHSHNPWNLLIDDVHYIQMCLKYPRERTAHPEDAFKTLEEMLIFDSTIPRGAAMFQDIEERKQKRIQDALASGVVVSAEPSR